MSIKVLYPDMIAPITFKVIQWVLASTFRKSSLVGLAPPIFQLQIFGNLTKHMTSVYYEFE